MTWDKYHSACSTEHESELEQSTAWCKIRVMSLLLPSSLNEREERTEGVVKGRVSCRTVANPWA
jgi:hypothetical protein